MSGPQPFAIKFGTKRPSNAPPRPTSLAKRHRPTGPTLHDGSDSDGDQDARKYSGKAEAITGFGEGGAETTTHAKAPSGPRVIQRLANGGRYAEIEERRQQQRQELEREHEQKHGQERTRTRQDGTAAEPGNGDNGDDDDKSTEQYGLVITSKTKRDDTDLTDTATSRQAGNDGGNNGSGDREEDEPKRSVQDDAMDALLGNRPEKSKTIVRASDARGQQDDIPDVSTIAEYEDTPIDDFGAALLRGMGWNGEKREAKPRERERRPNTMGIGSKALDAKDELGAWDNKGASSDSKRSRPTLEQYRNDEKKKREQRGRGGGDSSRRDRDRDRDRPYDRDGGRDRNYRSQDADNRDRDGGFRSRDRR